MPITWNAESDAKLLVAIIATSKQAIDYEAVAKQMGEGVTVSALRHRIGRLKIKAQNANLPGSSDAANASPQSTPSKRKRGRPSKNAKNEEVKTEVKEEENEPVQEEDMDEDIQADGDYPSDC